ncbi:sensor histidine kinase [Cohnella soli]|uniref:Sensor histidine kinase n=1 Tax=Cohnella soli TaxID=425005 RepID=A0ABW0I0C8_9BACL
MKSKVSFYAKQLDNQIEFIRNLQLQFMNDSDLQKLSFLGQQLEGYEEMQLVNRVKDRLATMRNSSNYITNVGVYIKSFGRTISTLSGITKAPNPEFEIINKLNFGNSKFPSYFEGGRVFFIESANNQNILTYVEISTNKLKETLNALVQNYSDSGAFLADSQLRNKISLPSQNGDQKAVLASLFAHLPNTPDELKVDNQTYNIAFSPISMLGLTLYTYINQDEITEPLKQINRWSVILSLVSVAIIIVFSLSVNWMIHKPLKELIHAFRTVESDNLNISFRPKKGNEFGYLFRSFERLIEKLKISIQENYEQKLALQHSELKQLQSQINPHFLYNSFFNIYMICQSGDIESASLLAQKLGSYYEFVTRSGRDEVPLNNEYRHALNYCDIQSIRFSNRIHIEMGEVPDSCRSLMVPRFVIQPVVENTFEHAFKNRMQQGKVTVTITYEDQVLHVAVEDNGSALAEEDLHSLNKKLANDSQQEEKTGLINVSRRIRLKYGMSSGVFVSRSPLGGLKADIVIDYRGTGA